MNELDSGLQLVWFSSLALAEQLQLVIPLLYIL